ncbi:MAG: hypothetical protein D3924_12275, partial [Candidatus Electrothrix sp. AR4]|nr:hypothetical protein [Candidatus Electrothrix sp. AR4]
GFSLVNNCAGVQGNAVFSVIKQMKNDLVKENCGELHSKLAAEEFFFGIGQRVFFVFPILGNFEYPCRSVCRLVDRIVCRFMEVGEQKIQKVKTTCVFAADYDR